MVSKKELRNEVLKKRDALTKEEYRQKSDCIMERVIMHPSFVAANVVLLFASFRNEVDTAKIFEYALNTGKEVYYPKVCGEEMEFYRVESMEDFEEGRWGIREPKAQEKKKYVPKQEEKICIIVPGAVFDQYGNRIGYGRGYYDKYLKKTEGFDCCKMGIGFACQMVEMENFPKEEHDVYLDLVITETNLYSR